MTPQLLRRLYLKGCLLAAMREKELIPSTKTLEAEAKFPQLSLTGSAIREATQTKLTPHA